MHTSTQKKEAILSHISDMFFIAFMCNNSLSANAQKFITDMAHAYRITDDEINQCFQHMGQNNCTAPHSEDDRLLFIRHLLTVALMDGSLQPEQLAFAADVCKAYGFHNTKDMVTRYAQQIIREYQNDVKGTHNNDAISEEEYQKELSYRIREGSQCLERYQIPQAFDHLMLPALTDPIARQLFLRIVYNIYPLFLLTTQQIQLMHNLAEQGYPIAQYAYGRYHLLTRPQPNSLQLAELWLKKAMDNGIADAKSSYALMIRDGLLGNADHDEFCRLREQAYEDDSTQAFVNTINELIYGSPYTRPDPMEIISIMQDILTDEQGNECTDSLKVEPVYYQLLGKAYQATGQNKKAEHAYINAIQMGHYETMSLLIYLICYNDDGQLTNLLALKEYTRIGCEHNDAGSYCCRADIPGRSTAQIQQDLEKACLLGSDTAPYLLGCYYYYGEKGFAVNHNKAWKWFTAGTRYNNADCYAMMATMIEEGNCPQKIPDNFAALCHLNALRLGNSDQLQPVTEAYNRGELNTFRNEIKKYYLPLYNTSPHEDREDDDGRYDAWV